MKTEDEQAVVESEVPGYVNVLKWVALILFVTAVISIIRSFYIEDAVDDLDVRTAELTIQTNDAKTAAVEARDVLTKALADFEERRVNNEGSSPEAITEALKAIARIEEHLCGGPCDVNNP